MFMESAVTMAAGQAASTPPAGPPSPGRWGTGRIPGAVALMALSLLLASCDLDTTEPPGEVVWVAEAFLAFPSEETLEDPWEGSAEIRSGLGQTQVTLQVREAEPGSTFGWTVRSGTCTTSGIPVAANLSVFQTLVANEFGEVTATVVLNGNVVPTQNYVVEVLEADDPTAPPLGCGNLLRVN